MTLLKPALRKSHIDILMQLVILITDAGRDVNSAALLSSVKITDQVPRCMAAKWQGRHWATHTHTHMCTDTRLYRRTLTLHSHTHQHTSAHTHTHTWALECAHVHIHLV